MAEIWRFEVINFHFSTAGSSKSLTVLNYVEKVQNTQILESILHHTSFTSMSQNQSRWSSQRPPNMTPFIRKGKVGDWKSHFSVSQTQRLSQTLRMRTAGTEAENLWQIPE